MTATMLRRYVGDRRFLFMLPRAVCLQLLHPAIATGIRDHALLRERIWQHKKRTVTAAVDIAFTEMDMRSFIRFDTSTSRAGPPTAPSTTPSIPGSSTFNTQPTWNPW